MTILWLVIGWRAMRAHERIADALAGERPKASLGRHDAQREERRFKEFIESEPLARHLDREEQLRRFAEWNADQV